MWVSAEIWLNMKYDSVTVLRLLKRVFPGEVQGISSSTDLRENHLTAATFALGPATIEPR